MRIDDNYVIFNNIEKQFQFLLSSTSPSTSNSKFACQISTCLLHNHNIKMGESTVLCYWVASVTLDRKSVV